MIRVSYFITMTSTVFNLYYKHNNKNLNNKNHNNKNPNNKNHNNKNPNNKIRMQKNEIISV